MAEAVKLACRNPEQVREWARHQTTRTDLTGYDFNEDPRGVVNYDTATVEFAQAQNDSSATACDQLRSRVGATLRTQARLLSIMWTAMPIRMSLVRHTA